ncbi:MAG: hypothetical protein AB1726_17500 [Planctomycetota bacterium]
MIRLSIATLAGAVLAAVVAWRLGGALGGGVVAGYLLGAGLSGLGALYQRHMLLWHPAKAMAAVSVSFLAKLAGLLLGALSFRYIDAAGARADWRSFLVAFAAAVLVVLPFGALESVRLARRRGDSGRQGAHG